MNYPALTPFSFNGPALIIRAEYAELIREGFKKFEVRNYPFPAKYEGRQIAIYASKRAPSPGNLSRINSIVNTFDCWDVRGDVRGAVVALATLESCSSPVSFGRFEWFKNYHFAPSSFFQANKTRFWRLAKITPLKVPFFVDAPRGAVVWFNLDTVPETKL